MQESSLIVEINQHSINYPSHALTLIEHQRSKSAQPIELQHTDGTQVT